MDARSAVPNAAPGKPLVLKDLYLQRKWLARYGGAVNGRAGTDADEDRLRTRPHQVERRLEGRAAADDHGQPDDHPEARRRQQRRRPGQ